jgi:tetratricopeptide (TPR) repeat protein
LELEHYEEALADLDCAISISDEDARVFANRAIIYWRMGHYIKALPDFDRAINLQPQKDWYWYLRAETHWRISDKAAFQKDLAVAIEIAQQNQQDDPSNMQISFNLALYFLANNMTEEAQKQYEVLIAKCGSIGVLRHAFYRIKSFIISQYPSHAIAQHIYSCIQDRIAILEQEPLDKIT